jgi:hypothetical protein
MTDETKTFLGGKGMNTEFCFEYWGGASEDTTSKFFAFILKDGEEWHVSQAIKMGDAVYSSQDHEGIQRISTRQQVVKVFSFYQGMSRTYYSFYFQLGFTGKMYTIRPFSEFRVRGRVPYFMAEGRFLTKQEALTLLDPASKSTSILRRQGSLSREVIARIITVKDLQNEMIEREKRMRVVAAPRLIRQRQE